MDSFCNRRVPGRAPFSRPCATGTEVFIHGGDGTCHNRTKSRTHGGWGFFLGFHSCPHHRYNTLLSLSKTVMKETELIERLRNPSLYPDSPGDVAILQTYISIICLAGTYAYKLKKPVDYGYLDYTSLEKRKFYCEEEVRLNRRFSPELYEGVVPLSYDRNTDALSFDGAGEIIDYAVKMIRISQERIMRTQIRKGHIDANVIIRIIKTLLPIYRSAPHDMRIASYGSLKNLSKNTDENFAQTRSMVGNTVTEEQFNAIRRATDRFYEVYAPLFKKRVKEGRIREGHGDLRTANIFVTDKILIFDCIEFNERFRCLDVAEDIAFLAMDLDFLDHRLLSRRFVTWFAVASGDKELLKLLNFYKCYRAHVRGKVLSLSLDDEAIPEQEKSKSRTDALAYFHLAEDYAKNMIYRHWIFNKPFLIIMSGLSGEGKSYIARHLRMMFDAIWIRTDEVRQQLFQGQSPQPSDHPHSYGTELYAPEKRRLVYEKLFEKADHYVSRGSSCILDATFLKRNLRKRAYEISRNRCARFFIIRPITSEAKVRIRLRKRSSDASDPSEADWRVYQSQKEAFESYDSQEEEYLISVNGDNRLSYEDAYDHLLAAMDTNISLPIELAP